MAEPNPVLNHQLSDALQDDPLLEAVLQAILPAHARKWDLGRPEDSLFQNRHATRIVACSDDQ